MWLCKSFKNAPWRKWEFSPENSGTNKFPLSKLFRNLENIFIPTGYLAVCRLLFEWNLSEIIPRNLQTLQTWTLWFKQDSIAKVKQDSIAKVKTRFDCKSQTRFDCKSQTEEALWVVPKGEKRTGRVLPSQESVKSFLLSSFHIMIEVSHCCPGRFELWRWTQETPPTAAKWGSTSKHY